MFNLLEAVHKRAAPTKVRSWVDDLAQHCIASREVVLKSSVQAAVHLAKGLQGLGCAISDKTTLLASPKDLGEEIQFALAVEGVEIPLARAARDLGADVSLGLSRQLHTRMARSHQALGRLDRLRRAVGTTKSARCLVFTGAAPQYSWGRAMQGTSPSELRRLRSAVGTSLCIRLRGGCLTTAFAISVGEGRDPAFALPLGLLQVWVKLWATSVEARQATQSYLSRMASAITCGSSAVWNRVKGPLAGLAATLMDMGWSFPASGRWFDHKGSVDNPEGYQVDFGSPALGMDLISLATASLRASIWAQAAQHYAGKGVESGADLTSAMALIRRLERDGDSCKAGMARCILQGACWSPQRLWDEGYEVDTVCPACGARGWATSTESGHAPL